VVVGTRDADLVPEITRAWGLVVSKDRKRISLCVPWATSQKSLDNLAGNELMSVCCFPPATERFSSRGNGLKEQTLAAPTWRR
jgi:hypothetical protein